MTVKDEASDSIFNRPRIFSLNPDKGIDKVGASFFFGKSECAALESRLTGMAGGKEKKNRVICALKASCVKYYQMT